MDQRLSGKVAVVTGAAQGLGEASAIRFAQAGATVAVVDIKAEKGEEVVAKIDKRIKNMRNIEICRKN